MNKWNFYTTNEIKPLGWLKRQLEIQAEGLSGNLDKIWPDIKNSAWIGGDKERNILMQSFLFKKQTAGFAPAPTKKEKHMTHGRCSS